jgi:hypothetical protein
MSKITKHAASLVFAKAPFYNLANIRKDLTSLIVRAAEDEKKCEAIAETIDVLREFLEVRHEAGVVQRAANVAAEQARVDALTTAAASARKSDAEAALAAGEGSVATAKRILKGIAADAKAIAERATKAD